MHVEAVHLLPRLLNRQNQENQTDITDEIVEVDHISIEFTDENNDSVVTGQVAMSAVGDGE